MVEAMGTVRLKCGQELRVVCVIGPDSEYRDRVRPFLGHKGGAWQWHIENALDRPLDSLETRFYLGEIDGEIVGNVCTFEGSPVGILGHVFTRPDHRRKGICAAILDAQTEDFRRRGGRFMTLGTGFDSAPFHIYQRYGFRSIVFRSGSMSQEVDAGYRSGALSAQDIVVRPLRWDDWPRLNVSAIEPGLPTLRNLAYEFMGPSNLEHAGLRILKARDDDRRQGAWVLVSPSFGAAVGLATISRDPRWKGAWQLDVFVHPRFLEYADQMVRAVEIPGGKVLCFLEAGQPVVSAALAAAGFEQEGVLQNQLTAVGRWVDVEVWGRYRSIV